MVTHSLILKMDVEGSESDLELNLEAEENTNGNLKRKKGVVNNEIYRRNVIKKARVKGSAYVDWKGREQPSVPQGEDCRCKRKCYSIVSEEDRNVLYAKFRSCETKNEQDVYLQSLISTTPVKRRRRRIDEEESKLPNRGTTYVYEVTTSMGKYKVCKKAFANIHGVTFERIRRLVALLSQGKSPHDMRGKNRSGNAKSGLVLDAIRQHIASFPAKLVHYAKKESYYLSSKLNLITMHSLFKEKHPELDVKYNFYRKVFLDSFSLKFGRPQVDTCCTCEELETKIKSKFLNEVAKRVHVAEKIFHVRRSKKFYQKMKVIADLCKQDESVGAISVDYMQNLQLPEIPVQETFYLRQLTVIVLGIHNLKDNTAVFFVYHEGVALEGPNEVASFLSQYIDMEYGNRQVENLHIFMDGCGGQNKNHTVVRMLSSLVSLGKFKNIEQYFPIRGHSFMPCDRDFSVLKRKIKMCDRIYTMKEYVKLILSSSKNNKFLVVLPQSEDVLDFKKWWPTYYKKAMVSVETSGRAVPKHQKISFKISRYMQFSHSENHIDKVVARDFINGLQSQTFTLRNSNPDPLVLPTEAAYPNGRVPINRKKMDDIKKLGPYLPQEEDIRDFYEELYSWPTCENENPEQDHDDNVDI